MITRLIEYRRRRIHARRTSTSGEVAAGTGNAAADSPLPPSGSRPASYPPATGSPDDPAAINAALRRFDRLHNIRKDDTA